MVRVLYRIFDLRDKIESWSLVICVADMTAILIGECPGLSSPESMGLHYVGFGTGRSDGERNCVSSIRAEGVSALNAVERTAGLMEGSQRVGFSGLAICQRRGNVRVAM